jgi:hypothetical protein
MDWNEDLLWPILPYIDVAFRAIIDDSCELFKAEATQDIKDVISALDHKLKSKFVFVYYSTSTNHIGR